MVGTLKAMTDVNVALIEHQKYKENMSDLQTKYDALYAELQSIKASKASNDIHIAVPSNVASTGVPTNGALHNSRVYELEQEICMQSQSLRNLEDSWSYTIKTLQDYAFRLNNLDQHSRLLNLLIHGLTGIPTGENSKGVVFSEWVARQINRLLPDLAETITAQHISVAHPLPTRSSSAKSCIIVRFVRRDIRNLLFYRKRDLKGSGVSFSEHLTTANLELYNEARKLNNAITWTSQCKIFVKIGDTKKAIYCKRDIEQLKELRPMQAPVADVNNVVEQHVSSTTNPEQYVPDHKSFPALSAGKENNSKNNHSTVTTKRGGKAGESSRGNGRGRGIKSSTPRGYKKT